MNVKVVQPLLRLKKTQNGYFLEDTIPIKVNQEIRFCGNRIINLISPNGTHYLFKVHPLYNFSFLHRKRGIKGIILRK